MDMRTLPLPVPTFSVPVEGIPAALHRGERELPFVEFEPGVEMQVLQVDIPSGLWVIRMRLQPGATLPTHRHGGEVFAFTLKGAWKYLEYPEVNTAGLVPVRAGGVDPHAARAGVEHRGDRCLVRDPRAEPEPRWARQRLADPRCRAGAEGLSVALQEARACRGRR